MENIDENAELDLRPPDGDLHILPTNVITNVMSHLGINDRLKLGSTCTRLRGAMYDVSLWAGHRLRVCLKEQDGSYADPDKLEFLAEVFPQAFPGAIAEVVWSMPNGCFSVLHEICAMNPAMTHLHVTDKRLTDEQARDICRNTSSLRSLTFNACEDLTGQFLPHLPKYTERLRILDLSYCVKISDESFAAFAKAADGLESVNLEYVSDVSDLGVTALLTKHSRTLKNVNVDGEKCTDIIFKYMKNCRNLKSLSVNFCQHFSDEALKSISSLEKLEEICLKKGTQFSDAAISQWLGSANMGNLRSLTVVEFLRMSDSSAKVLAGNCGRLTSLSLFACYNVTDEGLAAVFEGCGGELRELDISCLNKVTGSSFHLIPTHCRQLASLRVDLCGIDDAVLRDTMQRCHGRLHIPDPI